VCEGVLRVTGQTNMACEWRRWRREEDKEEEGEHSMKK
jgi:hypothetical protein